MKDVPSLAGDKSRRCLLSHLGSHPWVLVNGLCRGCRERLGAACMEGAGPSCQPGCVHGGSRSCCIGTEPGQVLLCLPRRLGSGRGHPYQDWPGSDAAEGGCKHLGC